MTMLKLADIKRNGGTQPRSLIRNDVIDEYAAAIAEGAAFPPVVVFYDGSNYWLADGFHRVSAYGRNDVEEIDADVRQGDQRTAILYSLGANSDHGLQRTDADKRRAIMTMLADDEWALWSDREIARQCKVHHTTVARVRADVAAFYRGESSDEGGKFRPGREAVYASGRLLEAATGDVASERTYTTKHGTVATMDTTNIGAPSREVWRQSQREAQAENDASREQARAALPDHIQRGEQAKLRNGSHHAAVAGSVPPPKPMEEHPDAIKAHRDELLEEVEALRADLSERDRRLTKYDDMVVQYEKGGFEAIIATRDERIQGLLREVEDVTADRATLHKSLKFWKKTAIDLGYVSRTSQTELDPAKLSAKDQADLSDEAGF